MNVIISNKNVAITGDLGIDVIKQLEGEFEVDQIVADFQNFYFQRMILDITAIKDYQEIKTLQKLSIALDMDKVILLLDGTPDSNNPEYLSKLISMGIYNFTTTRDGILYLYNNPNNYRDVAHIHQLETQKVVEVQQQANTSNTIVKPVTRENGVRIIGVKNVTESSGATTLIYMMQKELAENYNVVSFEVDKRDFMYFNDKNMISVVNVELGNTISKHSDKDIILVDVNNSISAEGLCHEVVHLVEPSVIKLNKMMAADTKKFTSLKGKKIILNQSMLSKKDVLDFEYESRLKVFYNMPPLDEREAGAHALNAFLTKLGFQKQSPNSSNKKGGLFSGFPF